MATVSVIGAAAGTAVAFSVLSSGGSDMAAVALGALMGIAAGGRHGAGHCEAHSAERAAMAQDILRRNGGEAVRLHEIEIEKRAEDLPLSSLRPDPWLGSEPLGHP